jgi:hypothetical protein
MGLKPLIQPLVQALITGTKDQLAQFLHGVAFTLGEHVEAVGGEGAVRHHVPKALGDEEHVVAFTHLKLLQFFEQLPIAQKPADSLLSIGMAEIQSVQDHSQALGQAFIVVCPGAGFFAHGGRQCFHTRIGEENRDACGVAAFSAASNTLKRDG